MQFSKEMMKGTAEVIVLQALNSSDAYGYELITRIAETSDNVFEFQEGTLYPLLYRLEDRGYVKSYKAQAPRGKVRRYYALTKDGSTFLKSRTQEFKAFIAGMQQALHLMHV
ncbi:MAG: helix-turn-helix transcriptional regulator [Candidatus Uhrbacteria bacterium]|nr:helix-turn-helix transcriptional regulator [Candidatus Uhrbacteria bacterium]